jgi:L-alanine-DL-glutamate epimerase-like enolase superfamily enzyme
MLIVAQPSGSAGLVKGVCQVPEVVAAEAITLRDEVGFTAPRLRLGRDRPSEDVAAIHAIQAAGGDDTQLMADFRQGLHLVEALERYHIVNSEGLAGPRDQQFTTNSTATLS